MEALLVSKSAQLAWGLPYLLWRAGFRVDVVANSPWLRLSKFTRDVHVAAPGASLAALARERMAARAAPYDWVIATDDMVLAELAGLERGEEGANLLPLMRGADATHLYSKIGLSRVLLAAGIKTPDFRVARDCAEAMSAARAIGYPVMVKVDASGGGDGIHECNSEDEIAALQRLFVKPLLIQKSIAGDELDLSAIYLEGALVHFSYAKVERNVRKFGSSVLRSYYPSPLVDPAVFDELTALGRALGAHGFVSISCMDAADGSGRYFIEADMRPNAWADFSVFYGEDAAPRLRGWFAHRLCLTRQNAACAADSRPLKIAHFLRLNAIELLANRYGVWRFIAFADARLVRRLMLANLLDNILALGKWALPRALRRALRRPLVAATYLAD